MALYRLQLLHVPSLMTAASVQLVMEVLSQLEGASALLFKSSHYPGQLVACRRGSPLIVGIKDSKEGSTCSKAGPAPEQPFEAFIASDGAAVVEHTKK